MGSNNDNKSMKTTATTSSDIFKPIPLKLVTESDHSKDNTNKTSLNEDFYKGNTEKRG